MEPQIVQKPAFTAVGMKYRGKNQNREIPQLWEQFIPHMGEIKHMSTPTNSYGIMDHYDPATGDFDYLAAFGVDSADDIPAGMEVWAVPEQTYAVFPCTLATIQQVMGDAYRMWLPQSAYQGAEGPMFEFYDENFTGDNSPLYIYVNIKPR
jgi:AraC family transcriptional regulator